MDARGLRITALSTVLGLAVLVAPAPAHDLANPAGPQPGAEHAAEHAAIDRARHRAARTWAALTPRERSSLRRRASARAYREAQLSVDAPADQIGRWDADRIPFETYAINSVQLPTGKVLFWGRAPVTPGTSTRENTGPAYVWDPADPDEPAKDVTPRLDLDLDGDGDIDAHEAPIFCTGQSLLPDGRVLAAGGTLAYPSGDKDFKGLALAFTFDPWTEQWSVVEDRMRHGRWYPSQVELADGRIAIYGGWDETGDQRDNRDLEIFDWRDDSITHAPAGDAVASKFVNFPYYPHLFTMPGGNVLLGGPDSVQSGLLDPAALGAAAPGSAWTTIGGGKDGYGGFSTYYRGFGMGVLLPSEPAKAAVIGGYVGTAASARAQAGADVIDTSKPAPKWSGSDPDVPPMNLGRSNGNVVILPDGSLASIGGGAGYEAGGVTAGTPPDEDPGTQNSYTGRDQELKRVELLRPGADSAWRQGPAQLKWRTYHSTAVLLPDGRVLSAGDDYWDLGDRPDPYAETGPADEAEIYSPAYLFDGNAPAPRPAVGSAPAAVRYGDEFGVGIAARSAARAVLVAPAAVTHAADMNQRHVELAITGTVAGKGVNVRAPGGASQAPPGYYMLFVLDPQGTPSVARWVRVAPDAPDAPVLTPDPVATPAPTPAATAIPTATPTATPTAGPSADTRAPRVAVRWPKLRRKATRLDVRVRSDEAARASVTVRVGSRALRRTLRLKAARDATVRIKLRRGEIRSLRAGRRLKVSVRVDARDAAGNRARLTRAKRLP